MISSNYCLKKFRDYVTNMKLTQSPFLDNVDHQRCVGEAYTAATAEDYFRCSFFQAIDTAQNQLHSRLDKGSTSLRTYLSLEQLLLKGTFPVDGLHGYSILSKCSSLHIELPMFRAKYPIKSVKETQLIFQEMVPEVRSLFPTVEKLRRLLLICPVSSCAAKRSFSALRRLKTWLRSSMVNNVWIQLRFATPTRKYSMS